MTFTLYLMRHGIAEDFDPASMKSDADRRLTDEGRDKLKAQAKGLAELTLDVGLILASPYARAQETADIIAGAFGKVSREKTEALVPHAPVDALLEELRALKAIVPTMAFGHEPLLSSIVAHVLGDHGAMVDMKKGALVGLELSRLQPPFRGQLLFLLPPKAQRAMA